MNCGFSGNIPVTHFNFKWRLLCLLQTTIVSSNHSLHALIARLIKKKHDLSSLVVVVRRYDGTCYGPTTY